MHVGQLVFGELILIWLDLRLLEIAKESDFVFQEEEKSSSLAIGTTSSTTDSMNIIFGIIGRIVLDDPINQGEIQASLRYICA